MPADPIEPSVADVALLLRTRTTGDGLSIGLGADTGPDDVTTFTANTRPTSTEVEDTIATALGAVKGMLLGTVPEASEPAAKHAVALYAVVLIEVSFFRDQANDEAIQILRDLMAQQIVEVNRAISEATPMAGKRGIASVYVGSIIKPVSPSTNFTPGIDDC
ncbi:hypothetical protein UFOVP1313_7 [uncultured Caudovirales phage]|uniref:Uncharacterized protein n=1 Tax=uncultured Caudovirales phage TaxID=2100421 RepID=A0A6J5RYU0_9CAUD|nr:hypothetical protein UFOVP1313_7 [uncultured Caudovirales phage]